LGFARQGPAHVAAFELLAWLQGCAALVARMAEQRHIAVRLGEAPALQLYGDQGLLQQALVNVLINALQATAEHGTVTVAAQRHEDTVEITVQDQGAGVPAEVIERVFDPFFTTKPEGEGTGLGLSISIGIVEQHGGRLTLENSPAGGALARLVLPLNAVSHQSTVQDPGQ